MVGRFVNVVMSGGKKNTAETIVYGAFEIIESKTRNDPLRCSVAHSRTCGRASR